MRLCMKRHGEWLHGAHRTRRDGGRFMWHQPCQRCKYTTSVDIQKRAIKQASHSCRIPCERSESARERRITLYKSNHHHHHVFIINFSISVMSLTPSLPQPVKCPGRKMHRRPTNSTFSGLITSLPSVLCVFMKFLSRASVKNKT